MSTEAIYAEPDMTKKVRKKDRDREQRGDTEDSVEMEERVVDIYQSVDDFVTGPQEDMTDNTAGRQTQVTANLVAVSVQRSKTERRPLRVVAGCLGMLCLILLVVIIAQAVLYAKKLKIHNTRDKWCPNGWTTFRSSCYYRSTEPKTWQQSRDYCLTQGADLVVINSGEEQEFIKGLSPVRYPWIGLNRTDWEAIWTWVDGTPLTTLFWRSGYPPQNDKNCAVAYGYNEFCSSPMASICEK